MPVFDELDANKGTISSALGKELAIRVLSGDAELIDELARYCLYLLPDAAGRNVRAGAAKAIEIVSESRPDLIAMHLQSLQAALSAPEPQTRWMMLRTCGFCAHLVPEVAANALPAAEAILENKEGLILASSADLFLGALGAVSSVYARRVLPLLIRSAEHLVKNEADWLMEALTAASHQLDESGRTFAVSFARRFVDGTRKSTRIRASKLLQAIDPASSLDRTGL